jgi:hypothetical protein
MDNHQLGAIQAQRATRRLSTMDGWREIGNGLYTRGGAVVKMISVDSQFDPEKYHDDYPVATRISKLYRASQIERTGSMGMVDSTRDPFAQYQWEIKSQQQPIQHYFDRSIVSTRLQEADQNPFVSPFDDSNAITPEERAIEKNPEEEPPYHVFNKRQKWLMVIIIGAAGLFSGLSSNIYFPSLDQIAQVCPPVSEHSKAFG